MTVDSPAATAPAVTRPGSQLRELELRGVSRAYGAHLALRPLA